MLALVLVVACSDDGGAIVDARPIDATATDGSATDAADVDAVEVDALGVDAIGVDAGDLPPGPISNFTATGGAAGLALAWTNPGDADLAGVLIVASAGAPVTFAPQPGMTYPVGTTVAAGERVVNAALATSLASVQGIAGVTFHFSGWAVDAAAQYSAVATTTGRTDVLGAQSGQIQVFLDGTVVVTQQPADLHLAGTATVDGKLGTIALDLGVENRTGRVLFNLKGLVDSTSNGVVTNPTFPAVNGVPMAYYGPEAIAVGAAPSRTIDLTGVDGSVDPVVLQVHFVDAPSVVLLASQGKGGGGSIFIADTTGERSGQVAYPDQPCAAASPRGVAVTRDGRYAFSGAKSVARINRVDLTALSVGFSATLLTVNDTGAVGDVALSADESRLYAVVHDGNHARGGNGCVGGGEFVTAGRGHVRAAGGGGGRVARTTPSWELPWMLDEPGGAPVNGMRLVEFDTATLAQTRSIALAPGSGGALRRRGRLTMVTPTRGLVVTNDGTVNVIDFASFSEVDQDLATPGVQPLEVGVGDWLGVAAVSPDRTRFALASQGPAAGAIAVTTFDATTLAPLAQATTTVASLNRLVDLTYLPNGRLLVLARDGSAGALLEAVGATLVAVQDVADGVLVAADPRGYLVMTRDGVGRAFDAATDDELDLDGDPGNGVTPLTWGLDVRPHGTLTRTPF